MPDINIREGAIFGRPQQTVGSVSLASKAPQLQYDLIELLFFAYRDFVADADAILAGYKFGRAHHRVLHFVDRNPGLTVADLLDILQITKQSLGRVLKDLMEGGFIVQREGREDRRQRLLSPTRKGEKLALRLARLQSQRFATALQDIGPQARPIAVQFLLAMVDPDKRGQVASLIDAKHRRC